MPQYFKVSITPFYLSAHFRPKSVDESFEKINNCEEDAMKTTPHQYPEAQNRTQNPTNNIAVNTEMLQQIPHEDMMLYLPPSQHELGNTDMPQ